MRMAKASTPWSTRTVSEGGTDSPIGDLVTMAPDIVPAVSTGFISAETGKFTGIPSDDRAFTFQDAAQALGPGASIFLDVNMIRHDVLILACLDASGNAVNVDLIWQNPATLEGPYNASPIASVGVNGAFPWSTNKNGASAVFVDILKDENVALADTWEFFKLVGMRGTLGTIELKSNEAGDAGIISTAFMRLV